MTVSRLAEGPTHPTQRQHDASDCVHCAVATVTHHCPRPRPHPPLASLPRLAHLLHGGESAMTRHTQLPPPPTCTQRGETAGRRVHDCARCAVLPSFLPSPYPSCPCPCPCPLTHTEHAETTARHAVPSRPCPCPSPSLSLSLTHPSLSAQKRWHDT
jgi:hypothetical protein